MAFAVVPSHPVLVRCNDSRVRVEMFRRHALSDDIIDIPCNSAELGPVIGERYGDTNASLHPCAILLSMMLQLCSTIIPFLRRQLSDILVLSPDFGDQVANLVRRASVVYLRELCHHEVKAAEGSLVEDANKRLNRVFDGQSCAVPVIVSKCP